MSNIILGVTGSISAYRAADLARDLMRLGHSVRVCLTDSAEKFVTPILFETLTGQPCLQSTFDEPERSRMAHIDWARQADIILIAPATANTINKLANGFADDMLSTLVLASQAPIVIAPAMNPVMLAHQETQSSIVKLSDQGVFFVDPIEGDVASGETGQGKLASNSEIINTVSTCLSVRQHLVGKTILITSGPTQEPIDTVRYISNRSSGKMGFAMARAAQLMGAKVIFITGPTNMPKPPNAMVVKVNTADEMLEACQIHAPLSDWIIGVAAVADYKVERPANTKLRRTDESLSVNLIPNPDIIATLAKQNSDKFIVAFAAEPSEDLEYAREKMVRKGVKAIVLNNISNPHTTFGSDVNQVTLIGQAGVIGKSEMLSKLACSVWIFDQLVNQFSTRSN